MLPAVRPAPAGAAAAGSPAASVPPPAVYGYTPNQSAPRSARDTANQGAPGQARSKWQPRQPVTSAEQERGGEWRREKSRSMKRCERRDLVRNRRAEIKRETAGGSISRTGRRAAFWRNDGKDQQKWKCVSEGGGAPRGRRSRLLVMPSRSVNI